MNSLKKQALGEAVFSALVTNDFDEQIVLKPSVDLVTKYNDVAVQIYQYSLTLICSNIELSKLLSLLLARISTIEELRK